VEVTLKQQMLDAAFDFVLDAVRDNPDEMAVVIDKLTAELGADRINAVLDRIELRLGCRLPDAIRDAARAVEQVGHA